MDLQIRLSNLHEATAQQVFDQAALHLLTQNEKSKEGTKCAYRTKDGLKCAAGCFISDKDYTSGGPLMWEGHSWPRLVRDMKVPEYHGDLIYELQTVHDAEVVHQWPNSLSLCIGW